MNSIADFAAASVGSAMTQRELELAGIVSAYNAVTDRLKVAHERLTLEVGRLHDELKRKNEELRRSERLAALGQMAAGLAHEIRNPLGGIALYASMLERSLAGQATAATQGEGLIVGRTKEVIRRIGPGIAGEGPVVLRVERVGARRKRLAGREGRAADGDQPL
ncbi:MAG TPA: histidine kinase dimerization/phospho-acceptor domain-containing protein [Phycisphaerae bacterium]|nr:histidine kinase dimerization/phospho-acceptor domain-containing protein [Phycisphaerae bacterium]